VWFLWGIFFLCIKIVNERRVGICKKTVMIAKCIGRNLEVYNSRWLLATVEVYNVSHIYREGNGCADWVTKWIRECDTEIVMLGGFPLELRRGAEADASDICCESM